MRVISLVLLILSKTIPLRYQECNETTNLHIITYSAIIPFITSFKLHVSVVNSIIEQCNTKCFKFTTKTQQQCLNISILLWQHVSVLLDHLKTSIQRQEVQSVHWLYLYNVFRHCCFLTVILKQLVLLVELKHNGVSAINKKENCKVYDECTRNQGKKCKKKGKGRLWVLQHCCLEAYCTLTQMSSFIHLQRLCTHQAAWETSASEGRNYTWNLASNP